MAYKVVRAFEATEPISGRKRKFEPGEIVICHSGQAGPTLTIEANSSYFTVDRSTLKNCCVYDNRGVTMS